MAANIIPEKRTAEADKTSAALKLLPVDNQKDNDNAYLYTFPAGV